MAADVCRGGQPFAFGDVGETTMPQVAQCEVTGAFLAHNTACSGSEGLEIVEAREDTTTGRSDRLGFVVLGHCELVHRLAPDAELGGERCERFHRMPGPAALREAVEDRKYFGARDVRLVSPVERLCALGLLRKARNVHGGKVVAPAHARPAHEPNERRALLLHGRTGHFSQPRTVVVLAGGFGQELDPRKARQQVDAPRTLASVPVTIADGSFHVGKPLGDNGRKVAALRWVYRSPTGNSFGVELCCSDLSLSRISRSRRELLLDAVDVETTDIVSVSRVFAEAEPASFSFPVAH
ncbi:MAG: hypothetical protein JRJ80_21370 [Deltaproteobacteria bacterium]|nr:hypothetical protein [Deltaproteobacteria bacterium]